MMDREFAAYVEGLPPQDRITVEQALTGLREALVRTPRAHHAADHDEVLELIDVVCAAAHN